MMSEAEENNKSMVKILREIRDKINLEIQDMTPEELRKYFRKKLTLHPEKYQNKKDEITR